MSMKHGAAHGDVLVDGVRQANALSDGVVGDGVAEDGVEEDSVVEDGNAEDGVVEGQSASMMEALPSELLLLVLGLLPTEALQLGGPVRNVCRRWRRLAGCPSLWRRRRVRCDGDQVDSFLRTVAVAPELGELDLTVAATARVHEHMDQIEKGCARVRSLKLTLWWWDSPAVAALVRHYSARAETLDLCLGYASAAHIGTEILRAVAASPTLLTLRVRGWVFSLLSAALDDLARGCPALQQLDVEHVESSFGPVLVAAITARRPLRGLVLPRRHCVVGRAVLEQVAATCPGLRSLGADYVDGAALVGRLPQLRTLRLWFSYERPDHEFLWALHRNRGRHQADDVTARWGDPVAVLARLEELRLELDDDLDFPVAVLAASRQVRSLHLAGDWLPTQLPHLLRAAPASVEHLHLCSCELRGRELDALRAVLPRLPALRSVHGAHSAREAPTLLWERKRAATQFEPCYVS